MEDGADTDAGQVAVTGRQRSLWQPADVHYQLDSSSFASGSGTNNGGSRAQNMEETTESSHDKQECLENFGKGLECSRPSVKRSSKVSPKLLVTGASGAQKSLRSHSVLSLQGQWSSLQGFSDTVDSPDLGNMDTDSNLSMGLDTRTGFSEIPALAGHRGIGSNQEFSMGRSGISVGSSSTVYTARIPGQADSIADCTLGRGPLSDKGDGRGNASSILPVDGKSTGLVSSGAYHTPRSVAMGVAVASSRPLDWDGRDDQRLFHGSSSNFNALSGPLTASGSNSQRLWGEDEPCSTDSRFFLSSTVTDRTQARETHILKGISLGKSVSPLSNGSNNVASNSRVSACKRKTCTSSLLVGSSCRSGSPHSSGLRESYGVRSTGGCSSARRPSGSIGCVSASDVVASASAVVTGRCAKTSIAVSAVDEPRTRKSSTAQDGDSPCSNRAAKTSSGINTFATINSEDALGQLEYQTSAKTQAPFARAVRRAVPVLQPGSWCSESVSLVDCSSNTDFTSESGSALVRSTEQLMGSGGGRRSGSPLVPCSRSGTAVPGRRNDQAIGSSFGGERLSHRYSSRYMVPGAVDSFGEIGTESSRLRLQNYVNNSAEVMNNFGSIAAQSQTLVNAQVVPHSRSTAGSPPSRLPHIPVSRSGQNFGSSHVSMSSAPFSGLAPSRLPPSAPSATSPPSSAMEILPSGSAIFQRSLLPRSSPPFDGRSEREFGSADENLLGFPFRGLRLSDGEHQPRLVAEGLAEILLALDRVERDEDLTFEQLLMLEATLLFGGMGLHDQHSDLRLDVDNMSYEELLALEERIGNVSTGLTIDVVNKRLKKGRYSSQAAAMAGSLESDIKCSVCQEEYEEGDELGKIDCGHSYHIACIKQWLVQKNQCPICKASALS